MCCDTMRMCSIWAIAMTDTHLMQRTAGEHVQQRGKGRRLLSLHHPTVRSSVRYRLIKQSSWHAGSVIQRKRCDNQARCERARA